MDDFCSARTANTAALPWSNFAPPFSFYDEGFKSGADLERTAQDAAVLISLLLQHGIEPEEIEKSLSKRVLFDEREVPASLIGVMVEQLKEPPQWAEHEELVRLGCGTNPEGS